MDASLWVSLRQPRKRAAAQSPGHLVLMRIRPQRDYLLFHHQARKEWLGDLGD
jgi:hypothetical protein